MAKLKPIENRLIITAIEAEGITRGGVIIPDLGQEIPMKGKVISIGPGKMNEMDGSRLPMTVKVDDIVIFPKFGPMKFKEGDDEYIIIREEEILAIIEE